MKKIVAVFISSFTLISVLAKKALAQSVFGINDLADAGISLGTRSIEETIGGIINIFLGFLGILATLLLLYAGFLWMTSRGNAEKVERAKLLIASALIGLVIIVSAYAISRFILGSLYNEVGPTGPGGGGGPGPGGLPTCTEPLDPNEALICGTSIGTGPVGSGLSIYGHHFDTDITDSVIGYVDIGGERAEVVECSGSSMWYADWVKVRIPDALTPGTYDIILYNDLGNASVENPRFQFTVTPGTSNVNIDCLVPNNAAAPTLPTSVQILGDGFSDTTSTLSMTGWDAINSVEIPVNLSVTSWSDLEINAEIPAEALASNVTVTVGPDSDSEFFNVTCAVDGDCLSGCCNNLSCIPDSVCSGTIINPSGNAPVIQSISPENGEEETLVTIYGYNFGSTPGTVTFDGVPAELASTLSGGACTDVWTDTYIIVGVSDLSIGNTFSGAVNVEVTQAAGAGGEVSDPYPGFTVNDLVRPGICSLGASQGQFGDVVGITGINFAATDEAYFDTLVSYDTSVTPPNSATAEVPNVVGNLGVTMQTTANVSSNAYPFSALSIAGGAPIISELSPDNGPVESYVTIMGSNFGDDQGVVWFDPDNDPLNGNEVAGDFSFPAVCGIDYWFDDHIIVKVPSGPWTIGNSYAVRIERNPDNALSNDQDFTITNAPLGPQVCLVSPDNGPVDSPVTISGENFGNAAGEVVFYNGVSTNVFGNWSNNQILNALVPVGAETGPMLVRTTDPQDSNAVVFEVGACQNDLQCGGAQECCIVSTGNYCAANCQPIPNSCEYIWEVNTQAEPFELYYNYNCASGLQSPTPWPDQHQGIGPNGFPDFQDSIDAFVDANISAVFTRDVEDADFNSSNILVHQCSDSTCSSYVGGPLSGTISIINGGTDREGFTFNPDVNLLPDTWYEVELGTFEAYVGIDTWTPDPVADQWLFRTRDSGLLCEVTSVAVTPQSPQANTYPGRENNFSASPLADNCNICGSQYDWNWTITNDPNPVAASISGPAINLDVNQGYTRLTGGPMSTELLSTPNFVTLTAENTDFGVSGETYPVILAPALRVEGHTPDCDDSCANAAIWVDFNTTLQGPLNIADFDIYQCLDPDCSGWDTGTNYFGNPSDNLIAQTLIDGTYRVQLEHNFYPDLPANERYVVIVNQSLTNIHGYSLGIDYRWDFGVGDTNCTITGADIVPDNYTSYSPSDINYYGYAIADVGICGAQPIQCQNCDFRWSSSDTNVATIELGGIGAQSVDASPGTNNGTTNITLDLDGSGLGLGQATDSTPLTINISNNNNITQLAVDTYFPNCGACTNSIAEVWFNSDLQAASVDANSVRIYDITDNQYDTLLSPPSIVGNRHVVLDHGPFDMGHEYRIEVSAAVVNTDNDNIAGGWQSPNILIEEQGCLADAVWVDPVLATAGRTQTLAYRAVTTYNAASCGAVPIACTSCSYNWQPSVLGNFNNNTLQSPNFTTLASVNNGDSDTMTLNAFESGNPLPVTDGTLNIVVGSGGTTPLSIVDYWPYCDGACDNSQVGIMFNSPIDASTLGGQYSIFDISNGNNATINYTLTGGDTVLIIQHDPLILGHQYEVNIYAGIQNTDGNNLTNPLTFDFTVGDTNCRINDVDVLPSSITVGPQQGVSYAAQAMYNSPSCGPIPVYCPTCTYAWTDSPDLGWFAPSPNVNALFTTHSAPPVTNGQSTQVQSVVNDQGNIFSDYGDLTISIGPSANPQVTLINIYPPNDITPRYCTNILPYMDFDISQGDLDRNSLEQQAIFYENTTGLPIINPPFSISYSYPAQNVLRVMYEPQDLLTPLETFFFGFTDMTQVTAMGGNPMIDGVGISDTWQTNDGANFVTGANTCSIHRVEVIPEQDVFTCVDPSGCPDDADSGTTNNQHQYQSFAYDIQNNLLAPAGNTYSWSSNDANIVSPVTTNQSLIYGTAGDNGLTHLNVEVFLNTEPSNIVGNNSAVEVNTCQSPWPDITNYPWEPTTNDMNFSTYYCEEYGTAGEVPLPSINIPNEVNSPDPNVLREYITTINYPITANSNNYLGSLAYYEDGPQVSWFDKLSALFRPQKVKGQTPSGLDIIAFRVMANPEHLSVADWFNKYAPNAQGGGSPITVNGYEAMQAGASIYVAAANIEAGAIYTNIYIIAHNVGANATTLEIYNQMVNNFKLNTNLAVPSESTCINQTALSCSSDFDCPNFCSGGNGTNQTECTTNGGTWTPDVCDAPLQKLRRDTKRLSDLVYINNVLLAYGQSHKACANNSTVSCNSNSDCPSSGNCVPYFPALNSGTYLNGSSNTNWPSWNETLSQSLSISLPVDPINLFNGCSDPYNSETCWNEVDREFLCPANSLVYMYNIENPGSSYYLGANFEYDMQSTAETFADDLFNPPTSPYYTLDLNINSPYCNAVVLNAPGAAANPYCGNGRIDSNYCTDPRYDNSSACTTAGARWVNTEECDNQFWHFACSESPPTANPAISIVGNQEWWNEQTIGCNPPGSTNECTWYRPSPALTNAQCGGYCGDGTVQPYYEDCDGTTPNGNYTCAEQGVVPVCGGNCQVVCNNGTTIYAAALCGDGIWSPGIEQCDPSANPTGTASWDCTEGGRVGCSNTCQLTCSVGDPYQGLCGDGTVNSTINPNTNEPYEACDYANYTAALPSSSNASSTYGCSLNCEFNGQYCGDGVTQYGYRELCDPNGDYDSPEPLYSSEFKQYDCRYTGTYTAVNGSTYQACTPTLDGWCGDGFIQDGITVHPNGNTYRDYGEECDPGDLAIGRPAFPPSPSTTASSQQNQYLCDVDCVGRTGGWCGDGEAQQTSFCSNNPGQLCTRDSDCATGTCEPLEVCDLSDYPGRPLPFQSNANNTYTCNASCSGSVANTGGYCGDYIKQDQYYEGCDWGPDASQDPAYMPWPLPGSQLANFSSPVNQYVCSDCVNFGGYCGNGIVDGACATGAGIPVNCTDWYCVENGVINYSIDEASCTGAGRVWQPTSSYGCTEYQCTQRGGNFYPYEQCDNGFDPSTLLQKDVDIVYLFDTSGSLSDEAAALCTSLATVVNTINTSPTTQDINYRVTIFPLGDGDASDGGGYELTASQNDNIQNFFERVRGGNISDDGIDVTFNALYSNCLAVNQGLVVDPTTGETIDPERVRYLSFYDDATNDINGDVYVTYDQSIDFEHYDVPPYTNHWQSGVPHNGDEHHFLGDGVNETCHLFDLTENWGYAMKRIIEDYNWLPGYHRIVVPVSDEYAVCGNGLNSITQSGITYTMYPNSEGLRANEDFDASDGVYDVLVDAVDQAIANKVYINPVLLNNNLISVGQGMAGATGGQFTNDTNPANWQVQTLNVINSTICDGTGPNSLPDGQMDCTTDPNWNPIPPPPPPVPVVTPATYSIYVGDSISHTIQASNSPQMYGLNAPVGFGLNVNVNTGQISGTPAVGPGSYVIPMTATNAGGTGSGDLTLIISSVPTPFINSPTSASIISGNNFNYTITITAASNPSNDTIVYSVTNLLPGLSVDPNSGVISGIPSNGPGSYPMTLRATNTDRNVYGEAVLNLTINPQAPVIISASSVSGTRTFSFSYSIVASNSPSTYNFIGTLPTGVSFNASSGVISGTPSTSGSYGGTIYAGNVSGTDSQSLNINIGPCAGSTQSCASMPCCSSYSCSSSNICSTAIVGVS